MEQKLNYTQTDLKQCANMLPHILQVVKVSILYDQSCQGYCVYLSLRLTSILHNFCLQDSETSKENKPEEEKKDDVSTLLFIGFVF